MAKQRSYKSAPWHLWVVGGLLLLWNGIAAFDYVATVIRFEPYLSEFPEEMLSYYFNAPLWMYVMWGIASFGGLTSAIFLLMRRSVAVPIFGVAWICSVIAVIYAVVNPPPSGDSSGNLFMAAVLAITLLILIYMHWLNGRDVLR